MPDLIHDLLAYPKIELRGNSLCQRNGGQLPGLGYPDHARVVAGFVGEAVLIQKLRELGRFSASCLARNDHDQIVGDCFE